MPSGSSVAICSGPNGVENTTNNRMRKMIMDRTFHPVGQGAFYTEEFRSDARPRYTTVYDCGTETAAAKMDIPLVQQIQFFKSRLWNNGVDLLFISHFHNDHVKGLDELLKGTTVKRMVIPMLTPDAIMTTRIHNLMIYGDDARATDTIIQDIYYGNGEDGRFGEIIAVSPETRGPEGEEQRNDDRGGMLPKKVKVTHSGEEIVEQDIFWKYIPFNSIDASDQRAIDFVNQVRKIPGVIKTNGELDVDEIVRNKRKELREIYKKVMKGGNDNLYTLVVESTPIDGVRVQPSNYLARCLYLGDFEPDGGKDVWQRFVSIYNDYPEIGLMQVPHHGSENNWKKEFLYSMGRRQYIISTGIRNKRHHPDYWIIRDIKRAGHRVSVVCEEQNTEESFHYYVI